MSEFRRNATNGEWVILAPERMRRPTSTKQERVDHPMVDVPAHDPHCPFCPEGATEHTPNLYLVEDDGLWQVKSIRNQFAAVSLDVRPVRGSDGFHLSAAGYGSAEVIIESRLHNTNLTHMPFAQAEHVVTCYRERFNALAKNDNIRMITVFRNQGATAGASQVHPHSQIIGTLVPPPRVAEQIIYARRSFDTYGVCLFCHLIRHELREKERVFYRNDSFVAFCPYASTTPFEIRIYPFKHRSLFGNLDKFEIHDLAVTLQTCLKKMVGVLGEVDYNLIIRSASMSDGETDFYHWYIVLAPKTSHPAGFEMATGIYINSMPPEEAAKQLSKLAVN